MQKRKKRVAMVGYYGEQGAEGRGAHELEKCRAGIEVRSPQMLARTLKCVTVLMILNDLVASM